MRRINIRRVLILLWICAIFASVIIGRLTAASFVDNVELEEYLSKNELTVAYCGMGYDPETNVGYLNNDEIQRLDDLLVKDTIVAKIRLTKGFPRKIYTESVLSQADIVECMVGKLKKEEKIEILEPVDCGEYGIYCTDGYSLMQEGKEYIVFLKQLKNTYYGHSKYIYVPSSTLYSKYLAQPSTPRLFTFDELEEPQRFHSYNEMKNEEVYLYDKTEYERYLKLKREVLEQYQS